MYVVLLAWLSLGVQLAHSSWPYVQELTREKNCVAQKWPDHQVAVDWKDGADYKHLGFDVALKKEKYKIADFMISLQGKEGKDAAILCDIKVEGTTIDGIWLSRSGEEATESFVFGYGDKIKDHVRIGMRGELSGETTLDTRVEIYGDAKPTNPPEEIVKCGTGNEGLECPDGLEMKPRLLDDF